MRKLGLLVLVCLGVGCGAEGDGASTTDSATFGGWSLELAVCGRDAFVDFELLATEDGLVGVTSIFEPFSGAYVRVDETSADVYLDFTEGGNVDWTLHLEDDGATARAHVVEYRDTLGTGPCVVAGVDATVVERDRL